MKDNKNDKGFLDDVVKKQKNVGSSHPEDAYKKEANHSKKSPNNLNKLSNIAYGKSTYELRDIKKPSISDQIRIASGLDQAVLKFISYAQGNIRTHAMMQYISREFELILEDQDGIEITDKSEALELIKSWNSMYFDGRKNSRDVAHLMFSAPHGTDRNIFKKTVSDFLNEQYKGMHDYVFAAHDDTEHPHVHAMLCMRSVQRKKLDPRKKYIHALRKDFAKTCRENGIIVDASYRYQRGLSGKSLNSKMYNMRNKRHQTPFADKNLITKIKDELTKNIGDESFISLRNEDIKQHFYDTSKKLYEQSKETNDPSEAEKNLKAANLLYYYSRSFDEKDTRFSSIKRIVKDIEKSSVKPSKEALEIVTGDIGEEI